MVKQYNGHHCWNCWNVALWLGNDEVLYNIAYRYAMKIKNKEYSATRAANALISYLCLEKTPDGAKYTLKGVRSFLISLTE